MSFVVALMAGAPGAVAQAQEAVEPLPPSRAASAHHQDILAAHSAPQARDQEAPRLHFDPALPKSSNGDPSSLREPATLQVVVGVVVGVATSIVSIQTYDTRGNLWYTGGVVLGGALATGAIVCAVGQLSPTRRGGCRGSLVGALVGVLGAVPGLLLLHLVAASPCSGAGEQQDGCLGGRVLEGIASISAAAAGYTLGTALGAQVGWRMSAVGRGPAPTAARVSLLSVRF